MTYFGTVTFGLEGATEENVQDAIELIQSIIQCELPDYILSVSEDIWEDKAKENPP